MIKKLSESTIKKIAAGEVIQKTHHAVKELIENSLDAKSTEINIYFKEYGLEFIKITDNGLGINKKDISLAATIHATSKTNDNDEFFGTTSLGFRGEALASIDVVSDLYIESNGCCYHKEIITNSNVTTGTTITIKNLFQNLPARIKFIKNPQTEFKYIKELIKKYIILRNDINWKIIHNQKIILEFNVSDNLKRLELIFKEIPSVFKETQNDFTINAYIFKKNFNLKLIYVNNRPIKDKIIFKYIESLFKEHAFINESPSYILHISIDHILVDYNVHPSKEEVKFFNYNDILQAIYNIFSIENLAKPLINSEIQYEIHKANTKSNDSFHFHAQSKDFINENNNIELNKRIVLKFDPPAPHNSSKTPDFKIIELETFQSNHIKIFGQFHDSFILFEKDNELIIFDQHAGHERKLYEEMKNNMKLTKQQTLLDPIKLNLSNKQLDFINEIHPIIESYKFKLKNSALIAVPNFFKELNLKEFLENLNPPYDFATEFNRLLANIACKKAIKAKHPLNFRAMESLIKQALYNPPICNHGRPVFKTFTFNEVSNFFKRT